MSTYLVAFIVGEYDFVENKTQSGTLIRVFTPVNKTQMGNFSLDVSLFMKINLVWNILSISL